MIEKVTLIGAGNLSTQLGKAFNSAGVKVVQVYSRTEESAKELAILLGCPFTSSLNNLMDTDLFVIAVKDGAIGAVLRQIHAKQSIVVHTAGSVPMEILKNFANNFGVFYPLQTFSKKRDVDFSDIPVCLEANSQEVFNELALLAGKLSETVRAVTSEERKVLHLAAVFTCNFVNHFYHIGASLIEEKGLDFDLLKPLIMETAQKVMDMQPIHAQTGPAVRFDEAILKNHLDMLSSKPKISKIYSFVSESIHHSKKIN
jgi:predicted short-subunit dehydrogenase-like oxidoreductase (DUF2520 family)